MAIGTFSVCLHGFSLGSAPTVQKYVSLISEYKLSLRMVVGPNMALALATHPGYHPAFALTNEHII